MIYTALRVNLQAARSKKRYNEEEDLARWRPGFHLVLLAKLRID